MGKARNVNNRPEEADHTSLPTGIPAAIYPAVPPLEECLESFWKTGPEFESVHIIIEPPKTPLELLEALGPAPFERGGFPLIGFLATTYDKVTQYALERGAALSSRTETSGPTHSES